MPSHLLRSFYACEHLFKSHRSLGEGASLNMGKSLSEKPGLRFAASGLHVVFDKMHLVIAYTLQKQSCETWMILFSPKRNVMLCKPG